MIELIPMRDGFILAAVLFALGLAGLLVRRNLIFILMSIEVMLNAAGLAFVVAGARWGQPDGQVMFLLFWQWPRPRCRWVWLWCCSSITSTSRWIPMRSAG